MTDSRFSGWRMLALCFGLNFAGTGFFFFSYGVYFKDLAQELGASRLDVSLGLVVFQFANAIAAPFLGKYLDRYPKRIVLAGLTLYAFGLAAMAFASNLMTFFLSIAFLVSMGAPAASTMGVPRIITNWFVKRRGFALALATMGISTAGVIMPPTTAWLMDWVGRRHTMLIYAGILLLLYLPLMRVALVGIPARLQQKPLGGDFTDKPEPIRMRSVAKDMMANRTFWLLAGSFGLMMSAMSAILVHMVPHVSDLGFAEEAAAVALSACALTSSFGKPVFGFLADKHGTTPAILASLTLQILGAAAIMLVTEYPMIIAASVLFGMGTGGVMPLQAAALSEHFGDLRFGAISGIIRPAMLPLGMLGTPLAGWIFDETGRYFWAFIILIILYSLSALLLLMAGKGKAPRGPIPLDRQMQSEL